MSSLVTGNKGFIGSHLEKHLISRGDEVTGFDLKDGVDILDMNTWPFIAESFDTIYHLAARPMVQDSVEHPVQTFEINVLGTLKMLEYAKRVGARFVFTSSAQAEEEAENPYALQKFLAERLIRYYAAAHKVDYTIYRIYNVFGPGEHGVIGAFQNQVANDIPLQVKGGNQKRDFIYVEDVVKNLASVRNDGIFDLGSGNAISIQEIADMISDFQEKLPQDKDEPMEMRCTTPTETLSVRDYLKGYIS